MHVHVAKLSCTYTGQRARTGLLLLALSRGANDFVRDGIVANNIAGGAEEVIHHPGDLVSCCIRAIGCSYSGKIFQVFQIRTNNFAKKGTGHEMPPTRLCLPTGRRTCSGKDCR